VPIMYETLRLKSKIGMESKTKITGTIGHSYTCEPRDFGHRNRNTRKPRKQRRKETEFKLRYEYLKGKRKNRQRMGRRHRSID